jgi:hypothetical protein
LRISAGEGRKIDALLKVQSCVVLFQRPPDAGVARAQKDLFCREGLVMEQHVKAKRGGGTISS